MAANKVNRMADRPLRERAAYEAGTVLAESTKLHRRFSHVFLSPNTQYGEEYFEKWIERRAKDGIVLDYGCHAGGLCPMLVAYRPRRIIGIDIFEQGIAEAKKRFGHFAEYYLMDAHKTTFRDNFFDIVLGRAILHHLEYKLAIKEIRRILKPGGYALFIEPLEGNPVAKFIRWLTPAARTVDERPLSRHQIKFADNIFGESAHHYFGLASASLGILSSLVSNNPANWMMKLCHGFDMLACRTPLKYYMRSAVLVWRKVRR